MQTRYAERRQHIRVPVRGPVRWRSGADAGACELRDISPCGAGLRMSPRCAACLNDTLTLEVDLTPTRTWQLARNARVVRQVLEDDGTILVGVEFAEPLPR